MKVSLLWLWLGAALVHARGGGRHGGGGPLGGGPLGGLFGLERPDFVNTTCTSAQFACPLYRRREYNDEDPRNGTFVCRTTYHPMSGQNKTRTMCIPTHKGLESDQCGCCGDDCPTRPEFEDITCTGQEDLLETLRQSRRNGRFNNDDGQDGNLRRGLMQGGHGGGMGGGGMGGGMGMGGGGRGGGGGGGHDGSGLGHHGGRGHGTPAIVCREVYNPFTGDQEHVTIPIDSSKSLDGDVCGCCDGTCPDDISRRPFERPEPVPLDCAEALTTCKLPRRRHDEEEQEGVFVCRSRANPLTGVSEPKPTCISMDAAWESDQCGCCGQDCPERPTLTDIGCDGVDHQCERRNGQTGVFVCRSFFHPLEGTPVETSLCVPEDKTWAEDDCGCCEESGCPVTPSQGFEDEETQIMSFAMTAAGADQVAFAADGSTDGNTAAAAQTSDASGFSLRMMTTRTGFMVLSLAFLWW